MRTIRSTVKELDDISLVQLWHESDRADSEMWIPEEALVRQVFISTGLQDSGTPALLLDRIFTEVWREIAVRRVVVS